MSIWTRATCRVAIIVGSHLSPGSMRLPTAPTRRARRDRVEIASRSRRHDAAPRLRRRDVISTRGAVVVAAPYDRFITRHDLGDFHTHDLGVIAAPSALARRARRRPPNSRRSWATSTGAAATGCPRAVRPSRSRRRAPSRLYLGATLARPRRVLAAAHLHGRDVLRHRRVYPKALHLRYGERGALRRR